MSKTKVVAVSAIIAAGFVTPLLIQHQSQARLRTEVESLRSQNTQLAESANEAARLSNLVAAAKNAPSILNEQSNELLRLRGEVARLRRQAREIQPKPDGSGADVDPTLQAAFNTWAVRASLLKERLQQMPERKIPEFQFLTEKDWFDAVKDGKPLETDADFRQALSTLRNNAKSLFGHMLQQALRSYIAANNNQMPSDLAQLKPFFPTQVDDSVLARYSLLQTGQLQDLPKREYLVAETAPPVDDEYDTVHRFSLNGINTSTVNRVEDAVKQAGIEYAQANQGVLPTEAAQLTPYLKQPLDPASIQKVLSKVPPGITTLDQLKAAGILEDGAPR